MAAFPTSPISWEEQPVRAAAEAGTALFSSLQDTIPFSEDGSGEERAERTQQLHFLLHPPLLWTEWLLSVPPFSLPATSDLEKRRRGLWWTYALSLGKGNEEPQEMQQERGWRWWGQMWGLGHDRIN